LTESEIEAQRQQVCVIQDRQDSLKRGKAAAMQKFKARAAELESMKEIALRQVSTGKRDAEILVQDFMTPSNEVVSIRFDSESQEIVERRTATAEELQEELFGADSEDPTGFATRPS
jgi:hypothetical protein